jgi:hypothetical protein
MKGRPLTEIITQHTARKLPPDGVDLRAELAAHGTARVRQALSQAGGDYGGAARLLRMSRNELVHFEARLAGGDPNGPDRHVGVPDSTNVGRIAGGVEFISAAAIKRLHTDGYDEKAISRRLGCNPFLVEKVLREQTEQRIVELDRDGLDGKKLSPRDIALELRLPVSRVRRVLVAHDVRALARRCRASGGQS